MLSVRTAEAFCVPAITWAQISIVIGVMRTPVVKASPCPRRTAPAACRAPAWIIRGAARMFRTGGWRVPCTVTRQGLGSSAPGCLEELAVRDGR
jgi:hypothetical protein